MKKLHFPNNMSGLRTNILFVLLTIFITSCDLIVPGLIGPPVPADDRVTYIYLEADRTVILSDNNDRVKIKATLLDSNGNELDDIKVNYYVNNMYLRDKEFTTPFSGEYTFTARVNDLVSNSLTIKAKQKQVLTSLKLSSDVALIEADKDDKVTLSGHALDRDGDRIDKQNITYYVDDDPLDDNDFKTEKPGTYTFKATAENITSNPITVSAISFFDISRLHHMEIVISQEEWNGLIQDMLDYNEKFPITWWPNVNYRTGNYRQADLIIRDTQGNIIDKIDGIGFRTKGNTSRKIPEVDGVFYRTHFKIKFDKTFDQPKYSPVYNKRKKRTYFNLDKLVLKTVRNDCGTKINEMYSYYAFNQVGVHAPKTTSVHLTITIDGKSVDYGIFTGIEPIDKKFLTKRYDKKSNDGDLYKCLYSMIPATLQYATEEQLDQFLGENHPPIFGVKDWETNYIPPYDLKTNEDTSDHSTMRSLIGNLASLDGTDLKQYLDENFEVDMYLRFLAMDQLLGMPDGYWGNGNNYYLYFNNNGKIAFIPYDYDHSIGTGWYPGDMANNDIDMTSGLNDGDSYDPIQAIFLQNGNEYREIINFPLVDKVLAVPEYKNIYLGYLAKFTGDKTGTDPDQGVFSNENFDNFYDAVYSAFSSGNKDNLLNDTNDYDSIVNMDKSTTKWGQYNQPASITEYFNRRISSVRQQLEEKGVTY